ncbi:MAG: carboxylating nicotinate-nucleotide diphosphorylase [Candidatus Heimdallarchaeota archaeon]|nr:carboxylating nicotinate-nucleotide diphosphorylase [Candidatus Heimdallarchaeota archaeon]
MFLQTLLDDDIKKWLSEDVPNWDPHTMDLDQENEVKATIIAKQDGVISGIQVLERIFELGNIHISTKIEDGKAINNGDVICELRGKSTIILQLERTALNIFTHMSGIATTTSKMVQMVNKSDNKTIIAGTRKTLPGLRKYQKYAITCGGGDTHRMTLESMIMLKENHLSQFNSISEAIQNYKKTSSFSLKIEVEVRSLEEAIEAANEDVDIIMLDNFEISKLNDTISKIKSINNRVLIEISGGVSIENIKDYLDYPIDIISSGALTHSSNVFDASLLFDNV